jgi:hypothetical protein
MSSFWLVTLTVACIETGVNTQPIDAVAVVSGDFDNIGESLGRHEIAYQTYEGFICCASYDPDLDPALIALKSETLFTGVGESGAREIFEYDAVMVNSGTRGLGAWQYNGVETDDHIAADETAVLNIQEWVERSGLLWASDWAYDLVEKAWPEKIDFYGDDDLLDEAQVGTIGRIEARVTDSGLHDALGTDSISLAFNFSNWMVMESVANDDSVDVLLRGDAEVRLSSSEGFGTVQDIPLLVKFDHGEGQVILSSFHWNAQNADLVDTVLLAIAAGLRPGSGSQDSSDSGDSSPSTGGTKEAQ